MSQTDTPIVLSPDSAKRIATATVTVERMEALLRRIASMGLRLPANVPLAAMVTIDTSAAVQSRPGDYLGFVRNAPAQPYDPSGTGNFESNNVNEFGEPGQPCRILNGAERSTNGHMLLDSSAHRSLDFPGILIGLDTGDPPLPVFGINGFTWGDCQ